MGDMEVMQWFFDLEKVSEGFNWHINVDSMVARKNALDAAVSAAKPAAEVMDAYKLLAAAFGPDVTKALLQSDDAFPEVNHSGKSSPPAGGKVLLYVDKQGSAVVAEIVAEWGAAPKFEVVT